MYETIAHDSLVHDLCRYSTIATRACLQANEYPRVARLPHTDNSCYMAALSHCLLSMDADFWALVCVL